MKEIWRFRRIRRENGSALIMILWALVLIGFLAGEYLEHNRGKACLAFNALDSLKQKEAVDSILHLYATDAWPISGENSNRRTWDRFSPGGVDLWASVDDESKKMNINTAPDALIRDRILKLLSGGLYDEADGLADAILDWRDADDLVRINGAEENFYVTAGLTYKPANGPFKVLTELLLVKGVTPKLFWGDPFADISTGAEGATQAMPLSLLDEFTIYPPEVRRINIVVPGKQKGYTLIIAFQGKKDGRCELLQLYRNMMVASGGETQSLDQTESGFEF